MSFRVIGPGTNAVVDCLIYGLDDAEFCIPGQIVADIGLTGPPRRERDGSVVIELEALTIVE